MRKQYFKVRLHNPVYRYQLLSDKSVLKKVYEYSPCCVAENGIVMGANSVCDKYNIVTYEPLSVALSKCADLCTEAPDFKTIKKGSEAFKEICSRFGIVKTASFDECIIEAEEIDLADIYSFTSAIRETILDELKLESEVVINRDTEINTNPYTAAADRSDFSFELIAELLSFKLKTDQSCAKLFSVNITDEFGLAHKYDRRVDVPCDNYELIHFVLKNMIDSRVKAQTMSVNLYDITLKQDDLKPAEKPKKNIVKQTQSAPWDYVRHNRQLTDVINKNELFVYEKLREYISNNIDNVDFYEICALAEKANTRRLKLGNYYINPQYAEDFTKKCNSLSNASKIIFDGYCPFSLIFNIKRKYGAEIYYKNIDDHTIELLSILEEHSSADFLQLKPAKAEEYDLAFCNNVGNVFKAKTNFLLVRKSFFSSDERNLIKNLRLSNIYDFGSFGFIGTFDQFVILEIDKDNPPDKTKLYSLDCDNFIVQSQNYITDDNLPCWVLYRNKNFDSVYSKMQFNMFDVVCSNQLKHRDYNEKGDVYVISASCINGEGSVNLDSGCKRVVSSAICNYELYDFVDRDDVFFAAEKSSVLKVARKPKSCFPSPSTVLLIPKDNDIINDDDIKYYSSEEFRSFYSTALNHQSFTLSTDRISQFFLGKRLD